ncbi:MAG TPA: hypothetical protein VNJ47_04845 [Nevskiales bacterium]|nr:hypothetical protein [Nevskiales bacterium]
MKKPITHILLAGFCASVLAATPALAAKPDNPGNGKGRAAEAAGQPAAAEHGKSHAEHGKGVAVSKGAHFDERHRDIIREYFGREFRRGNCPPGLAKKNNGCMPPGLAKQWAIGRPLPHDIVFYDLPYALLKELGRAPDGYKYVRVGADVLMIAIGTKMVVDAIEDLNSL